MRDAELLEIAHKYIWIESRRVGQDVASSAAEHRRREDLKVETLAGWLPGDVRD